MKKISPIYSSEEQHRIGHQDFNHVDLRIGHFYRKLAEYQQKRFNRVVASIGNKLNVNLNQNPVKMILIRQIALNTVRIEEAELYLINHPVDKWVAEVENWLIKAQRERREAISLLSIMTKVTDRKKKVAGFAELRDVLREEENLPKTENRSITPNGHTRRFFNDKSSKKAE